MSESEPLTIELWDVDDIKDYPKNAKKHSPEQIKALAAAILEYGHDQPIVLDADGVIIKGHGRKLAVKYNHEHHGESRKAPVIVRRDLSKRQADAARLSDNRVTSIDYDTAMMRDELKRLMELDEKPIGFEDKEFDFALGDLDKLDEAVFVDDIGQAVEEQKSENAKMEAEADKSAAPVGDAFGFKRVTIEQSRRIRAFMLDIEAKSGKVGIDALMNHIDAVM